MGSVIFQFSFEQKDVEILATFSHVDSSMMLNIWIWLSEEMSSWLYIVCGVRRMDETPDDSSRRRVRPANL